MSFIIKSLKKIFMSYFAKSYIIIYSIIIILNIVNKINISIKFKIIKYSLI